MALRSNLATISRSSWHFRLVWKTKLDQLARNELENVPACVYWCREVPLAMVMALFFAAIVIFFVGGSFWMLGALAVWAFNNPLKFLADVGLELAFIVAFVVVVLGCVFLQKRIQRHCPPLVIQD